MPIVNEELYIHQGATFSKIINLRDAVTNANLNISGYSVNSTIKKSYYSQNSSANLSCSITLAANGEITLTMNANTSANVEPGRYLYDIVATKPDGTKERIREGVVTVTAGITGVNNPYGS